MKKKLLTGIMSLSLLGTLIPNVMAEDTALTYKGFNATSSAIIVDFNNVSDGAYIDEATVKENIVIEKRTAEGVETVTDYTLTVQQNSYTGTLNGTADSKVNKTNSITIKPTEGISTDAIYKVTVNAGVADTEGVATAAAADTGWFGVNVLFTDNFDKPVADSEGNLPYPYSYYGDSTSQFISAYYDMTSFINSSGSMQFADSKQAVINTNAFEKAESMQDYTIEYTYQYPAYTRTSPFTTHMRAQTAQGYYPADTVCRVELTGYMSSGVPQAGTLKLGKNQWGTIAKIDSYTPPEDGTIDVRMSTVGANVQYFIDGDKIFDVDGISEIAGKTYFWDKTQGDGASWAHSKLDNLKVTEVVTYSDEFPEMKVTGGKLEGNVFTITTNAEVENAEDTVTLTNGESTVDATVETSGNELSVTLPEELADGEYILTLAAGASNKATEPLKYAYSVKLNVSEGTVSKEDVFNLSLKGFNATKSAIILDFDGITAGSFVDEATVKENITIEKYVDGEYVEVTDYEFAIQEEEYDGYIYDFEQKTFDATTLKAVNKANSVIITPAEGVLENTLYRVNVAAGLSDTFGAKMIEADSTGWFEVKVMHEDDFNAKLDDEGNPVYPYSWANGTTENDTYLKSDYYTSGNWGVRLNIADTTKGKNPAAYNVMQFSGDEATFYVNENAVSEEEKSVDYTVEFDYQYPDWANSGGLRTYMRSKLVDGGWYSGNGYYAHLRENKANAADMSAKVSLHTGWWHELARTADEYTPADSNVKIRMSAIGNNIQYFVDNDKIFDIVDEENKYLEAGNTGFIDNNSTTWWQPSYIDNLVISKVKKYGDELPDDIEITNIGMTETEGKTTVNVTVNNRFHEESFIVPVAVYDSNNKLIGVTVIDGDAAVKGEKAYSKEIEISGAVSAKAFLWNNIGNMTPVGDTFLK